MQVPRLVERLGVARGVRGAAAELEVARHLGENGLPVLKEQMRQGGFVCFLMRAQCDLVEAGYEDVLGSMGVVFMGACR